MAFPTKGPEEGLRAPLAAGGPADAVIPDSVLAVDQAGPQNGNRGSHSRSIRGNARLAASSSAPAPRKEADGVASRADGCLCAKVQRASAAGKGPGLRAGTAACRGGGAEIF